MSPILQSRANASAIGYGAFSVAAAAGDFESIATVTVGSGGAANIEFTSIPATYAHLQLRGIARSDRAQTQDFWRIQFNSDTGSNYSNHLLYGDGSSAIASAEANATYAAVFYSSAASTTASVFSGSVFDVLDYANTNKYKTLRGLSGMDYNGTGRIQFWSGNWRNTNAITSLKLTSDNSANFAQYSHFALYGIKAA